MGMALRRAIASTQPTTGNAKRGDNLYLFYIIFIE